MPLWGAPKAGANPISALNFIDLRPGDDLTLLDGSETIVSGSKSIAFARGGSGSGMDAGSTFSITGCSNGSVVQIQGANVPPLYVNGVFTPVTLASQDAQFNVVGTVTGGLAPNSQGGSYLDQGRHSFYRAVVSTFVAGDMPVVTVKR